MINADIPKPPVKFKSNEDWQKLFWSITRNKVHEYFKENRISTKANVAMVVKSGVMLMLYLLPYVLLLTVVKQVWIAVPLALLIGIGKAGVGMAVMHDGLHGAYSEKKWVNKLVGSTMYLIGGNVFNWKIQHNIYHHAYTNITGYDEDIQTRWILRLSEHTPLKKIHRFQFIYAFLMYSLMTFSMLFGDVKQLLMYNRTGLTLKHHSNPQHELVKVLLVKAVYLFAFLVLPVLLTSFSWWQVCIGFMIIHLTAGFIMSLVFQMAHISEDVQQPLPDEDRITENDWAVHQLLTTANFAPRNKLLNWYIGGLNFQIEHHLFPHICHIHYPKISPIIEETCQHFGISYNNKPTLRAAIRSHTRRLNELGTI